MMRTFLAGAILGSLVMYLLDPESGRKRRFVAKDRYNRLRNYTKDKATDFKQQQGIYTAAEHTLQ